MRILMLTSRMDIGGAESHVYTLSRELVRLGHKVIVASAGGRYVDALEDSGVRHVTIPLDRKTPEAVYLARFAITRLVRKFRPHVVHSHSRIPSFIYGSLTELPLSAPLVTTVHMPFEYDPLTDWGDAQIAVSRDLALHLTEKYGICPDGVSVIENGVDLELYRRALSERAEVRERLGIPEGALVISCASRSSASRARAALYLCRAARKLLLDGEYLVVCISGGVGRERDLSGVIHRAADRANAALGRNAVIIVEGQSDVSPYIAASDIFVGVSRAAIEAASCGIPVVIAGNEGVGGILDRANAESLADANLTGRGCPLGFGDIAAMMEKLRDPHTRRELGEFSLELASTRYSARKMAERTLAVYGRATRPSLFVIGHYGAGNCGDEEAQRQLRLHLSDGWELRFLSKNKAECEGGISRLDARRIYRAARRADAVILGTGNLIQDETSIRSLAYYRAVTALCKKAKARLAVFSNGIGPLSGQLSRRSAAEILGMADYVSFREPTSLYYYYSELGAEVGASLGADVVLLCEPRETERVRSLIPENNEYVVVCPRGGQHERDTAALCELTLELKSAGITPVLIPMDGNRDSALCRLLADGDGELTELDAQEIAYLMKGALAVVGGRLHSAVLSASVGTPFVAYDSDGRIEAFVSYSDCGRYLPSGGFDSAELTAAIREEIERAASHPYSDRISRLRTRAKYDLSALREWITEK